MAEKECELTPGWWHYPYVFLNIYIEHVYGEKGGYHRVKAYYGIKQFGMIYFDQRIRKLPISHNLKRME